MHIDSGNMILNNDRFYKKTQIDQLIPTDGVQSSEAATGTDNSLAAGKTTEQIAGTFMQFINNGRANEKGITEKDVDLEELRMGIEIEMEHTADEETAKRIALDHLAETNGVKYYTYLREMEKRILEEEGKEMN